MRVLRPATLIFLLALSLGSPEAFASVQRSSARLSRQGAAIPEGLVGQLRGFLVNLWRAEGCGLDPLGRNSCIPNSIVVPHQVPAGDAGGGLGLLGRCTR